ncbi:MAG: sulfoxide reductase heme-binding subunit YedZ [Rhodospirillales bacterium]|nr:sulfoxide reductase heme-binding subunit YedZ [Rhodospirillales bacterium]
MEPARRGSAQAPGRTPGRSREQRIRFIYKPAVFALCLAPFVWIACQAATGGLGANPIEALIRSLGDWTLRFLLITLMVSPVAKIFAWPLAMRFRRMIGLFAFFYAVMHLATWIAIDQFFAWPLIWAAIVKKPFITIGMLAAVLLLPLAVTSTSAMIKRLGARRWKRLHMLIYPAAILGCVHFYMMVKADVREPLIYAGVLAGLLAWRVAMRWRPRPAARPVVPTAAERHRGPARPEA